MKFVRDFLSDQSYCDMIEMCIKRHDKFGAGTFFADVMISEHIESHVHNYEVVKRGIEIFPPDIDERFLDDIFNFSDCDDGCDD